MKKRNGHLNQPDILALFILTLQSLFITKAGVYEPWILI